MTTTEPPARHDTQRELLRRARERRAAAARPPRPATTGPASAATAGPAPLSRAQHRMWLMDRLGQDPAAYNVPFATRLRGPLDTDALGDALTALVRRHDVLRTRYRHQDGEPYQEAAPAGPVPVRVVDDPAELHREAAAPFDLATGPVLRALVVRHGPDEATVLLTLHHIAVDGASLGVLAAELAELYAAIREDRSPQLREPAPQYADFARREHTDSASLAHWKKRLTGAKPALLPGSGDPALRGRAHVLAEELAPEVLAGLRAVGRDQHATLFTVVLAAAFATLLDATGQEDLTIGCASSHRDRPGLRDLIGLCVNTLPVRTDLTGAADFRTLLVRVRDTLLEAQQHRDTPFDHIIGQLGEAARGRSGDALVAVTADVLPAPLALRLAGTDAEPVDIDLGRAKFGLGFYIEDTPGTPRCLVQYDRGRIDETAAARLLRTFADILVCVSANPARPLSRPQSDPTAPAVTAPANRSAQPAGERARSVQRTFDDLLGEPTGPDGDFFLLGGHSLLAVRLAERIREQHRLPLTGLEVMEHRTPRALAALLDDRARQRAATAPTPVRRAAARPGTVLVTGATGGVGAFVLEELAARGRPVRALARPESAHLVKSEGAEVVEGDLADPDSLRAAAEGTAAIIHAACTFTSPDVDRAAMRALLDGWRQGAFVFVSSTDAYGQPPTGEVAEDAPPHEPLSAYGQGKLDCERMLAEAAGTGGRGGASAVRAPVVWGPHDRLRDQLRWGATGALFQAARAGEPIPLPHGRWYGTPWIHAAALARTLVTCAENPVHGVVNAIGGHVGWAEVATELTRLLGGTSRIVPAADPASSPFRQHWHYRTEALAEELLERPGEDWRTVLSAMITGTL
ncbi:NAD-dependent epimerase/dehydratase family protein [Streptomyces sp. MUM 203J]|uniref:condensation domain-containing protein n=1 Tax=Streptomyces sp. MUM 203J TaxID=2791990 RepID=UPI001F042E4A|nr:condensation domain-containing protein [Streptomyces sp. MUM 203J]MCH0543125.1 NAD-dependent epimerase/dehydratase family protein [Streptomyces sp. MUM 203J]